MNAVILKTNAGYRATRSVKRAKMVPIPPVFVALVLGVIPLYANASSPVPDQAVKDAGGGYYQRALAQIQPLLADHAQDPDVQFRYGQALLGIGKADDAIAALKTAVQLAPDNGLYHRLLGEAYGLKAQQSFADGSGGFFSMIGTMKSAKAEFLSAVTLTPTDVQAHVDLAMYYIMVPGILGGSYSKAHAEENLIDKLDPIQGLQVRANEAGNKGEMDDGVALLKQAVAQDKTADSLIALGIFYLGAKRYDDALQAFHDAESQDPKAYGALYQVGKAAGLSKSHYDEGIESLKRYIAVADDRPDNIPSTAWAHFRLGNLYEDQGENDQAKAEYAASRNSNTNGDPELTAKLKDAESRLK